MTGRDCCGGRRRRDKTGRTASVGLLLLALSLILGGCGQDGARWEDGSQEIAEPCGAVGASGDFAG